MLINFFLLKCLLSMFWFKKILLRGSCVKSLPDENGNNLTNIVQGNYMGNNDLSNNTQM
jgi:hypothetical protein